MYQIDDSDSEEEFIDLMLHVTYPRRPKKYRHRPCYFQELGNHEFLDRFRLSKEAVLFIVNKIRNEISSMTTRYENLCINLTK